VKKGEIFGFLGPNGAGKSTTMRILLDLLRPTSGGATVLGMDTREDSIEIRRNVGFIPGEINFYNAMTPRSLFAYYERLEGKAATRLEELTALFRIPLDRPIKTFSKGMKQQVAIIQAFMFDPDIVIMDEPTTGLDPLVQQHVYDYLMSLKEEGKTIFISTHILSEAQKVCDRVAIIRNGSIVAIEGVSELRAKSGKSISVSFHDPVQEEDILTDEVQKATKINGGYVLHTGNEVQRTLERICRHRIRDITISESSLEDIFMQYYEGEQND
jgi:ABC-2 type transport system ATP-binding protein